LDDQYQGKGCKVKQCYTLLCSACEIKLTDYYYIICKGMAKFLNWILVFKHFQSTKSAFIQTSTSNFETPKF
jgi:hypothetical protein